MRECEACARACVCLEGGRGGQDGRERERRAFFFSSTGATGTLMRRILSLNLAL